MRVLATIKTTFKGMRSQWKQIVLMYALFPLILSLAMGYFQRESFDPEISMDKINITIVDEDSTNASEGFIELFNVEGVKDIFNVSNNGDYIVTIPKGYQSNLTNLRDTVVKVDEKKRVSRNNEIIIKSLIEQYGRSLTESMIISNKIGEMAVIDKEKLFDEVNKNIMGLTEVRALKTRIMEGERHLSSYENQASTMMNFMLVVLIMGCAASYHLDKENGSFKRLMSTPISRATFFNLDLLIFFISAFVYGLLYVLTFRIAGLAFIGVNPINILSILICQSLLIASISGFFVAFFKKDSSNIMLVVIMYFQILFGGAFVPVKEVTNRIFNTLAKFAPGNVVTSAYKSCILFSSFESISKYLIIMILVSMGVYVVSIIKVKVRWEE